MRKGLLSLMLLICLWYGKLKLFTFHNCTCRAERGVPSGRRGRRTLHSHGTSGVCADGTYGGGTVQNLLHASLPQNWICT